MPPTHELLPDALQKAFGFCPIPGFIRKRLFLILLIEGGPVVPEAFLRPLEPVTVLFRPLLVPPFRVTVFVLEIPLSPVVVPLGRRLSLMGMPVLRILWPLGLALMLVLGPLLLVLGMRGLGRRRHRPGCRFFLGSRKAET